MLGPRVDVLASAFMEKKILVEVILPADKENVDKLSLDQVFTKFLYILGHVSCSLSSSALVFILLLIQGAQ